MCRSLCVLAVFAFGVFTVTGAQAAVRVCLPSVVAHQSSVESEFEAKKSALDDWKRKAVAAGLPHPSWRIANNKVLDCRESKSGVFECLAAAQPCTLRQVPPGARRPQNGTGI